MINNENFWLSDSMSESYYSSSSPECSPLKPSPQKTPSPAKLLWRQRFGNESKCRRRLFGEERFPNDTRPSPRNDNTDAFFKRMQKVLLIGASLLPIRFSQDSVLDETRDGVSLQALTESLKKGWNRGKSESLTVVRMPDGKLTALDNRRLYCIKKCVREGHQNLQVPELQVPVTIYDYRGFADNRYLGGISRDLKNPRAAIRVDGLARKISTMPFTSEDWGYCVYARMRVFCGKTVEDTRFGFDEEPAIRRV